MNIIKDLNNIKNVLNEYSQEKYISTYEKYQLTSFLNHELRKGRIYKFNFTEEDITFIKLNYDVDLSNYKNYETDVNNELNKIINTSDNEINENILRKMQYLQKYVLSRSSDNEFMKTINFEILTNYNEKINMCFKIPNKAKKIYFIKLF